MDAEPTILIVDDYPDALDMWEVFFRASGFRVFTASDGPEALSRTIETKPHVVLMDLELPGLSGCEVARELRAQDATRHIPLIAVTGYSNASQLDNARRSGFDAVSVKPCDPNQLLAEVRHLIAAAAARTRSSSPR
jgi:CheY-like chemotaxis protein